MRHYHLSIIAHCTLIAVASGCSSDKAKETPGASHQEDIPAIEAVEVGLQTVDATGEYTATVEAFKTNNISSSSPNRIKRILVDVGARVAKGQKLVELDATGTDQLKVRLDNAQREYDRAVQLLKIGAGTQQSVDQLKTELDAQTKQYANLMENTYLVSPISGVVTARNYDPGDMTGSLPILTVEQIQPVKVMINISEAEYAKVKKGMKVNVNLDVYPDETFTGTVYLVHPSIDASTRTFTAEITIDNPQDRVIPGMFARVSILFGTTEHVVVPDRAVVKQTGSGKRFVYVYNPADSTVSYLPVELGQRLTDSYEITSGLEPGSLVVITGQTRLRDGSKARLFNKNENPSPTPNDSI